MRRILLVIITVIVAFCCGFAAGSYKKQRNTSFDDMIVNHPHELMNLVTPGDNRVKKLALELKTPQNAYFYVRDQIIDDPSLPAMSAGEVIKTGKSGCLSKAILLCSLYRAMGMPASDVRIVAGEVDYPTGIVDHAWLDFEFNGHNIQQDATNFLGKFGFDQFRETMYTQTFIRDEEFVFNDKQFAIVSPINMLKSTGHPVIH